MDKNTTVILNIRGRRFEVSKSTLNNIPNSKLATICNDSPSYRQDCKDHFFDTNPLLFDNILDAYSSGEAHIPETICLKQIQQQLEFWGLDESIFAPCCWNRYKELAEVEKCYAKVQRESNGKEEAMHTLFNGDQSKRVLKAYLFLELPKSSRSAKIWSMFIMLLMVFSVLLIMMDPLEPCRTFFNDEFEETYKNTTESKIYYRITHSHTKYYIIFLEVAITSILVLELLARFIVSPCKAFFFSHRHVLNIIDLIGVVPQFFTAAMFVAYKMDDTLAFDRTFRNFFNFLLIMKILRVFRLFELMKRYKALRLIYLSLYASKGELLLLLVLLTIVASIFACLAFLAEIVEDNFMTPFESLWWAIITMTTVGYGDVYPVGVYGRIIGALCAVTGFLVIGLPIAVISNNFNTIYNCAQKLHRLEKRHRKCHVVSHTNQGYKTDNGVSNT